MINLIIGGDICPRGRNLPWFKNGHAEHIFNDLLSDFYEADLSIINLECPLIDRETPINKAGSVLGVETECINTLKNAKIDIVNLANNHILDHGKTGIKSTLKACEEAGISTVGAGENLGAAKKILIKRVGDTRVAIIGICQHENSIATDYSYGANPFDIVNLVRTTLKEKSEYDYLIILVHAGNEHYPYPSPQLKDKCKFMIEMGANAVIVQHTHCPGCWEKHQNGYIVYGQGNLIFDHEKAPKSFYEGFLVKLLISQDLTSKMEIIPYLQSKPEIGANKMSNTKKKQFLELLQHRSNAIKNDKFLIEQWFKFCKIKKYSYMNRVLTYNKILTKLNRNGLLYKYCYGKRELNRLQNIILCEAHREVLETLFENKII
ncbi:CapA family protein [Desulfobacterales bacterium]|nr:CapA family protein [Desulfobacterales bacterium]